MKGRVPLPQLELDTLNPFMFLGGTVRTTPGKRNEEGVLSKWKNSIPTPPRCRGSRCLVFVGTYGAFVKICL